MFHIFYDLATGQISHACFDGDLYKRGVVPDSMVGRGRLGIDDDLPSNRSKIYALLRSLSPPEIQRPEMRPPQIKAWHIQVGPPTVVLNGAGQQVSFDRNPERDALFARLPNNGLKLVERLEQIRDNIVGATLAQTQAALRDVAIIQLRALRALRQLKAGDPGDP